MRAGDNSTGGDHPYGADADTCDSLLVAFDTTQITSATNRSNPQIGDPCHPLAAGAHAPAVAYGGKTVGSIDVSTTLNAHGCGRLDFESETFVAHSLRGEGFDASEDGTGRGTPLVAHAFDARHTDVIQYGGITGPLNTDGQTIGIQHGWAVRRLTPVECARLQGFPDDYLSQVTFRGKPPADGLMYRALGNSMAVNCMRWLGQRIAAVEAIP